MFEPKDRGGGGLGVGFLMSLNWVLLIKWIWRYKTDSRCLRRQVICGIHNLSRKSVPRLAKKALPGIWSNIVKTLSSLDDLGIPFSSMFAFHGRSEFRYFILA